MILVHPKCATFLVHFEIVDFSKIVKAIWSFSLLLLMIYCSSIYCETKKEAKKYKIITLQRAAEKKSNIAIEI